MASDNDCRDEFRAYALGICLAVVLSAIPFALVHWHLLAHSWLIVAISLFALLQVVVHFRFFLHIDLSTQKREDLELILFSALLLAVMAGGTIWILLNLQSRMH
jgi:cytochrome o ubiquinol oxidase subunit IV